MKQLIAVAALAFALPAIAACAHTPIVEAGPALPEGTAVALGQAVRVGEVIATPMRVVEDSRCPINARCIQAGRIVVETRIDGNGWRETGALILGEPASVRGELIALVSAEPGQLAGGPAVKPMDYRFVYEAGAPD